MEFKNNSKCWSCKKYYKQCSWSRDFIPVKGWKAKRLLFKRRGLPDIESFEVLECPEYEKETPRRKKKKLSG